MYKFIDWLNGDMDNRQRAAIKKIVEAATNIVDAYDKDEIDAIWRYIAGVTQAVSVAEKIANMTNDT